MRWLLTLLCVAQAACGWSTIERYRIEGSSAELLSTAKQSAHRLGWTTKDSGSGMFVITDYPRKRPNDSMRVTATDGALTIEGTASTPAPTEGERVFRLSEASEVLAWSTDATLHGGGGPRVASRSRAVAVALDLVLPVAGAFYALKGDPYHDSRAVDWQRSLWLDVVMRAGLDLLAGGLAAEAVYFRSVGRPLASPGVDLLLPILVALTSRVIAVISDWSNVGYRNAYSDSGLGAPADGYSPRVQYGAQ